QGLRGPAEPPFPDGQGLGPVRSGHGPAKRWAERYGAVEVVDADHALHDQVAAFPPYSSGHATYDVTGDRLLEDDGEAAQGAQILHRALHAGGGRTALRHHFDEWNQLRRVQRVGHEATVEPAHSAEDLGRREAARRRADQGVITGLLFDGDEELLLRRHVLVNRFDDPVG